MEKQVDHQGHCDNPVKTNGEADMENRMTELEAHLKCIRRDLKEVRTDVNAIKHRLAYSVGGTVVVLGLLGWVANSRFEQVISMLLSN
ncbi:hypothetical protein ACQKP5_10845 [Pseudomonas vancouverensis]|uniref:hypothetical protein n=1 Tax=Pseudomonas vancouverensis TaxID=95300 RepID=UPI003CFF0351